VLFQATAVVRGGHSKTLQKTRAELLQDSCCSQGGKNRAPERLLGCMRLVPSHTNITHMDSVLRSRAQRRLVGQGQGLSVLHDREDGGPARRKQHEGSSWVK
jgi:hypothetical protein